MLEENKELYVQCANLIDGWNKLSKNELVELYLEEKDKQKQNSYFSAIVCKFWNLVNTFYYKQGIKVATENDCHDWIIDGILKALNEQAWKNQDNKLFGDPKGPEKAIVVCIYSIRANFYQYAAYDKRFLNYNSLSLEAIEENTSDGFFLKYEDKNNTIQEYTKKIIQEEFEKKDYFLCFFYDLVLNLDIVVKDNDLDNDIISYNKLVKSINKIDDVYLSDFSCRYEIEKKKVDQAFSYIKFMPRYKIRYNATRGLKKLKNDNILKDLLVC